VHDSCDVVMVVMGMMTVTSKNAFMMVATSFFKDGFPVPDSCGGCGVHDVELYKMPVTSMMTLLSMMVQMQVIAMNSMILRPIVHLLFNN
jgi:hypothetical protein